MNADKEKMVILGGIITCKDSFAYFMLILPTRDQQIEITDRAFMHLICGIACNRPIV